MPTESCDCVETLRIPHVKKLNKFGNAVDVAGEERSKTRVSDIPVET